MTIELAGGKPTMIYRRVPGAGLYLPAVGFGTWATFGNPSQVNSEETAYELMRIAYEAGIFYFDSAEVYSWGRSETLLGNCIARGIKEGVWTRERLFISTKLYFGLHKDADDKRNLKGLSVKHLFEGLHSSLKRTGLDYYDLVMCHRFDPEADLVSVCRFFHNMSSGPNPKILYWGVSNHPAWVVSDAQRICERFGWPRPVVEQVEFSMGKRQKLADLKPLVQRPAGRGEGTLGTVAWSPLMSGVLTLKYLDRETGKFRVLKGSRIFDPKLRWLTTWYKELAATLHPKLLKLESTVLPKLKDLTPHCPEPTIAQMAIAWVIWHEEVTCTLLGARNVAQLAENLKAVELAKVLTPDLMAEINQILDNEPTQFTRFKRQ